MTCPLLLPPNDLGYALGRIGASSEREGLRELFASLLPGRTYGLLEVLIQARDCSSPAFLTPALLHRPPPFVLSCFCAVVLSCTECVRHLRRT